MRPASLSTSAENRVLNVIRFASALLVLVGHVRLLFFVDYSKAPHSTVGAVLYSLTSLGSEAVIVFFVLSGYFVGGSVVANLNRGTFSVRDYTVSRLSRLWLVLIPTLLLIATSDFVGSTLRGSADVYSRPNLYGGLPPVFDHDWMTLLGNIAFLQGLHVPVFGSDNALWSLSYEFWYYAMFPALMIAIRPGAARVRLMSGALFVTAAVIAGPNVLVLFPAWVVGAVVGWQRSRLRNLIRRAKPLTLAGLRVALLMATLGVMVLQHTVSLPLRTGAWLNALVAAGLVAVFVVDVTWKGIAGRALDFASRGAHFSYSLYAIHTPLIVVLCAFLVPRFGGRWIMTPVTVSIGLAITAGAFAISWLFAAVTENQTDLVRRRLLRLVPTRTSVRVSGSEN